MNRGFLFVMTCGIVALFIGCGESETAKEIRKTRKAGDLQRAYDIATVSLAASSDQMDVWSEYAYTILEIARHVDEEHDPFKYLAQSALMCIALDKYEGKLPDKWQSAATMTRGQIVGRTGRLLAHINVSAVGNMEEPEEPIIEGSSSNGFLEEQREINKRRFDMERLKSGGKKLVDPVVARTTVWQAGCYYELLNMIPTSDSSAVKVAMDLIDKRLGSWPRFSDLDPSFISDIRDDARADLMSVYNTLVADLEENDYFSAEHIINMELHP